MQSDKQKWDKKYARSDQTNPPSELLVQYWESAPMGHALDLACGLGRHALFLAEKGFELDAVDISPIGLARINHPRIKTIEADLDTWPIPANAYELIINFNFLDRRLFPAIAKALKPGGVLIFETALLENTHIRTESFKLHPGELKAAFSDLEEIHYVEKNARASLVSRKV